MDHYSISQMVSNAQDPLPTEASSCDLHQNIPKPDSFYGRSPDSLRKGKWTVGLT